METVVKKYEVYHFSELSKDVQESVISKYYEDDTAPPFLSSDIDDEFEALCENYNVTIIEYSIYYSLGYNQGDGLCFIGKFKFNNVTFYLSHYGRYYHVNSVYIEAEEGTKKEIIMKFKEVYCKIQSKLEKFAYGLLEYRMSTEEFSDFASCNSFEYLKDGSIFVR